MKRLKKGFLPLLLVVTMLVGMMPVNAFATESEVNNVPSLKEGVTAEKTVTIQTGFSYQLDDLMNGNIFEDIDGDKLTHENYFYQKSSDGGQTWGELTGFTAMEHGGINSSLSNSKEGTYIYKFFAYDGKGYSEDTWTLTLKVMDVVPSNIKFYVGQDQNYKNNGNVYPTMELYKTAGIDNDLYDYVGWFENAEGKKEYVYNPADYTIEDGVEKDYVVIGGEKYELHDYEKIQFTNSSFDDADEEATASGTLVDKYNMFYASVMTGRYSTRFYGYNSGTEEYDVYLGGQSMKLPMEKDIYGGGGEDLYFRLVSCYTSSKKVDSSYFGKDDYNVEMIMPVTGSMIHAGDAYVDGNYAKYPFMSYAAGNASLYNVFAYPTDTDNYIFSQSINNTTAAGNTVVSKTVTISTAQTLKVTVPADGDFGLYMQYNNFNTKEVEPLGTAVVNEDGTKTLTYKVSKGNGNYTWRLEDPSGAHVTKAGWMKNISTDTEKVITYSDYTDSKYHGFDKLGTQVDTRDEADIQVFLDHDGFKSVQDTYRVRAYRMWELINSDTANIMIEPDFNIQVLQGNESDVKLVDGGNASDNWIDVTPTTTDIVAVNYDAVDVYTTNDDYGSHGGFFPATAPERTGVFVATNEVEGKADASVKFNGGTDTDRGDKWDYNYDTWYYLNTDKNPTLDFTVSGTGDVAVSYATVKTSSDLKSTLSDWTSVTADENGNYSADLFGFRNAKTLGGTVIIKMTDSTGTSYRLVRVAEMSVKSENASNPGEPLMPGDDVKLTFEGLYRAVNKVAGIFNPTTYYLRYNSEETQVNGTLPQYQQMDNTSITLEIPEDIDFGDSKTVEYSFNNGHIYGSMYAASSPFSTLYEMTDTGVGTNFSAVGVNFVLSKLADVSVTVEKKVIYNVNFNIVADDSEATDATLTVIDSEGNVKEADENGSYALGYGKYSYSIVYPGYVCNYGEFSLDSTDAANVVDGVINKTINLTKASENAWDGETVVEPAKDENGVYQIGTGAELAWLAQTVNGGTTGASAVLTADIDLAGYNWTPIGTSSKKFAGSFDGKGYKVYNLAIDYAGTSTTVPYLGLFGCIAGKSTAYVEVKDFTVDGMMKMTSTKSVGNAYSGGAIGHATYANIADIHTNVDITVKRVLGNWNYVGGVVGYIANSSNITNCSNAGDINAYKYGAGIAGGAYATTITGCVNTGTITSETTHAAGIAALSSGTTEGCYNEGTISAGTTNVGGIIGAVSKGATVKNSFNIGNVSCSGDTHGAVIGTIADAGVVISDLYYLEGTGEPGIGTVKDAETQKAALVSVETLASKEFVTMVNGNLETPAFKDGVKHPLLTWEDVLSHIKEDAIKEIENYKNPADYREAQKAELKAAIITANAAIDAAASEDAVNKAVADAKAVMDKIKTDAELKAEEAEAAAKALEEAKEAAKEEIAAYKNTEDYRDAEKATLAAIIEAANAAIGEAKTTEEVAEIVASAKAEMDAVKTDAQLKAEEAEAVAKALAESKDAAKEEIAGYKDTDDYRKAEKATLAAIIEAANAAIGEAKTTEEVAEIVASAKAEMDAVKTDAQLKAEEEANKPHLAVPANVKASNVASTGKVKVTWSKVEDADGYIVYRATSKDGEYKRMFVTMRTSYTNTSAKAGKTYYYKVQAATFDKEVVNSELSASVKRTCDLKRPAVTAKSKTKKQVKLTWKKVDGAKKYTVYRATSKNGTYKAIKTTTKLSYINKKLKSGKTYYYKVKAIAKNSAANSAFSTVDKCKAK